MIRFANSFFALLLFASAAVSAPFAHEQLLFVTTADMNASTGTMQRYELHNGTWKKVGKKIAVNVGRNGLGWGRGILEVPHNNDAPVKHEGDGRAPAGIFALGPVFGYAPSVDTGMPYLQATPDLVCVDDSRSVAYNQILPARPSTAFGSFEWMKREDGLYRFGVVVRHNETAVPGEGSCIFLHIEKAPGSGTSGCTSMRVSALQTVIRWLEPSKNPLLVQVPAASLPAVTELLELPTTP